MRIACLYLPALPLQAHLARAPHLRDESVAIAAGGRLLACSRAARAAGLHTGLAATAARSRAPESIVLTRVLALERAVTGALAESLLACASVVDLGGAASAAGHAVYLAVPPKTSGASFAHTVLARLDLHGLWGRVGIADDRFTALIAAREAPCDGPAALFQSQLTVVPRGGSAAFLAPRPLSLLAIDEDILGMLAHLGVRTLGDFAALPPPSCRRARSFTDYQALARGAGPATLAPFRPPSTPVSEAIELPAGGSNEARAAALRALCRRVCSREEGRGRAITAVAVRTETDTHELELPAPTAIAEAVLDALPLRGEGRGGGTAETVTLDVLSDVPADAADTELDARDRLYLRASRGAVDDAIARVEALRRPRRPRRTSRAPRQPLLRGLAAE